MTGSSARELSDRRGDPSPFDKLRAGSFDKLRAGSFDKLRARSSGRALDGAAAGAGTRAFRARFAVLQTVGLAGLLALWAGGRLDWLADDRTYMTPGIAILFVAGVAAVGLRSWRWAEWIARALVMLGLIGTVLGFIVALSGVDPENARDVANVTPMVASLIDGMGTALYTTLAGSVGNLWLRLNLFVLDADRDA